MRAAVITRQALLREQDSNLRAPGSKPGRDASNPPRNGASCRCRPGFLPLTRRLRCRYAKEAWCARRESDPHGPRGPHGPQPCASTVPPRALGAAVRGRAGPFALRGRSRKPCAAASLPGQGSNLRSWIQSPVSCHWTTRQWWARWDLNPHPQAFEASRSAVGAPAHSAPPGSRTPLALSPAKVSNLAPPG